MSEETFLESLREQAEEEIAGILGEAGEEARRLLQEAERRAGREREERLRRASAEARGQRARILNRALAERRRRLLEAGHLVAGEVLEAVRESLRRSLSGAGREEILRSLLAECDLGGDGVVVVCRPEDRDLVEEIIRRRGLRASLREEDIPLGGLTVLSDGGRFVQMNTFEDRLRKFRPEFLRGVAAALGDTAGGGKDGP